MDFKTLKQKAIDIKDKAVKLTDKAISQVATKIGESSLVLKTQQDLEDFIQSSENKTHINSEGITKTYTKRSILVAGNANENFFKEFLFAIPVLITKSFSQNVPLKMADTNNTNIDIKKYSNDFPIMIVFENKEVYKIISGEDNIKKIVKNLNLDINKTIDEI